MRRAFFSGKHLPQWLESESGRLVRVLILISLSIHRLMKWTHCGALQVGRLVEVADLLEFKVYGSVCACALSLFLSLSILLYRTFSLSLSLSRWGSIVIGVRRRGQARRLHCYSRRLDQSEFQNRNKRVIGVILVTEGRPRFQNDYTAILARWFCDSC